MIKEKRNTEKNDKGVILEAFAPNSRTKDYINEKSFGGLRTDIQGLGGLY